MSEGRVVRAERQGLEGQWRSWIEWEARSGEELTAVWTENGLRGKHGGMAVRWEPTLGVQEDVNGGLD